LTLLRKPVPHAMAPTASANLIEDAPNLAGESAIYIDTQLKAFRLGKRTHEIMSAIAADLTNDEIREYADWYASIRLKITQAE
jgi:cytochrome c553